MDSVGTITFHVFSVKLSSPYDRATATEFDCAGEGGGAGSFRGLLCI